MHNYIFSPYLCMFFLPVKYYVVVVDLFIHPSIHPLSLSTPPIYFSSHLFTYFPFVFLSPANELLIRAELRRHINPKESPEPRFSARRRVEKKRETNFIIETETGRPRKRRNKFIRKGGGERSKNKKEHHHPFSPSD